MKLPSVKRGYLLLISILIIGAIASVITVSLILLGNSSERTSFSVDESVRARNASEACAEYALLALQNDPAYTGNATITTFTKTLSCSILAIQGTGNWNRTICTQSQVGSAISRLEIVVETLLPQTHIASWQEVPTFSLCDS